MRGRLLAAALGVLAIAALLLRGTGRGAAWAPSPAAPPPRVTSLPPSLPQPPSLPRAPSRNLFQYADERAPAVPEAPAVMPTLSRPLDEPPATAVTPPAVRVVGLIRRGGHLAAALMVQGEMMVARKGERAGGYTVLDVDDEAGVRLRAPDGEEMLLPPPSF